MAINIKFKCYYDSEEYFLMKELYKGLLPICVKTKDDYDEDLYTTLYLNKEVLKLFIDELQLNLDRMLGDNNGQD